MIKLSDGWFTLTYRAQKRYDAEYGGNLFELAILSVSLGVYEYPSFLERFKRQESHQIFAVIKLERGHSVILGRAQEIETVDKGETRVYKWVAGDSSTIPFEGVTRRSSFETMVEDLEFMDQLKQGPLLSSRPKKKVESDNDDYHNPNHVLPITVPRNQEGTVTLQIFNGKYKPAPFVETSVRWATILKSPEDDTDGVSLWKRKSRSKKSLPIEYVHSDQMSEHLSYKLLFKCTANGISMVELTFVARKYHFSLDSLGKGIVLNSI